MDQGILWDGDDGLMAKSSVLKRSGRCRECGRFFEVNPCHPQDHRFCSAACRARAWKREHNAGDVGKSVAALKGASDLKEAREAAELLWTVLRRPISIDDVREACETGGMNLDFSRNWVGSVFRGWLFCGTCKARHEGSHGRRISLWRKR